MEDDEEVMMKWVERQACKVSLCANRCGNKGKTVIVMPVVMN